MTAFTVDSDKWVQLDAGDTSNQLLARVSAQLASFTLLGNGTINSTMPSLALSNVTSPFAPGPLAVHVNALWFISLTLSLLSALFAIAVQQWLRYLQPPRNISPRTAVQIHHLRMQGLDRWQVPSIVSFLPLLLQFGVILFLAGLLVLLQSLDKRVAIAFTLVAAIGITAFLATAVAPLFSAFCAYNGRRAMSDAYVLLQDSVSL